MEPVPNFDPYAELEVSRTATTPTIDAAWRSLLKRNHPDLGGPRAAERTVRLNIAHDWLTDPVRRARYDDAREQARQKRAAASAAEQRRRPGSTAEPPAEPRRPTTSSGTVPRPTSARSSSDQAPPRPAPTPRGATRPKVGRHAHRRGLAGMQDRSRVLLVVLAAVASIGVLRVVLVAASPSVVTETGINRPRGPGASSQVGLQPAESTSQQALAPSTPGRTAQPADRSPSASEVVPAVFSLVGGGNHPTTRLQIVGGTYRVDYVVSSPPGDSCPWAIYLTDAAGLDLLMASAYPVDETARGTQRDSGIVPGSATIRVESTCPRWSAAVTRTGP